MNNLIRKSAFSFWSLMATVLFLVVTAIFLVSNVTHAVSSDALQNGRLITIHDRGIEKIILSQALTIGDAIKEAGLTVDENDVVEPAITEKLVSSNYQVNIYRANPVIIVDGNIRQKIMTPYQTAEQIAKAAGVTLYLEDKMTIGKTDNMADGVGLQLNIIRAIPFSFMLYGKTIIARTQAKTIGEMLSEKGIVLSNNDRVLPNQNTPIINNLSVRVWREGKQTITIDEAVAFDTEKIESVDQSVGYLKVSSAGVTGLRSVTYEIAIEDGQEVSRTEIASVIITPAIKQTVIIGIKGQYSTPSENENITWDYLISKGFSKIQTAGIMGNLMQEHHFNTTDSDGGYGLIQWTGGRRAELLQQPYPENIYTQLDFLMHELNTGYAYVRNNIMASDSLENAVTIFQNQYERCGICRESMRIEFAQNILASH